jgi:hypothetical protein
MHARLAVPAAAAFGLALLATGCGSGRSTEAAFRTQANRVCHEVRRRSRSADFSSRSGFAKGLGEMRAGVTQLARLQPERNDETAYRDLLARLRDINARLGANEAQLLSLQRKLRASGGRAATRTIRRFAAVAGGIEKNGLRAAADARSLGLGVCATDLSGGAPLAPPLGAPGRST